MERITKPMTTVRQQWVWNVLLPLVIFSITAFASVMLLLKLLPEAFTLSLGMVAIPLVSLNLGLIALNIYYVEWRRQNHLDDDPLAVRLLLLLSVWCIHNLYIILPIIMEQDSIIWNHQRNNRYPTMNHYVVLMAILFVWGSLNMRIWRYSGGDTPRFIELAIRSSQFVFVLFLIPVMLWSFTSLLCACS